MPYYWSVFNEILDSLETKSPLVEGSDLGQAYLGLDGLQLIYPDDNALVKSCQRSHTRRPLPSRWGSPRASSWLIWRPCTALPAVTRHLTGDIDAFLKDLSCDVLPVSMKSKSKLHDFGMHTLGQIAALPPAPSSPSSARKARESGNWPGAMTIRPCIPGSWRKISRKAPCCLR